MITRGYICGRDYNPCFISTMVNINWESVKVNGWLREDQGGHSYQRPSQTPEEQFKPLMHQLLQHNNPMKDKTSSIIHWVCVSI